MSNTYFFILGRNPKLSLVEIFAVVKGLVPFKQLEGDEPLSAQCLVLDLKEQINVKRLMSRLGGVIKIGEIIEEVKSSPPTGDLPPPYGRSPKGRKGENSKLQSLEDKIFEILQKQSKGKRVYFGFSRGTVPLGTVPQKEFVKSLALSLKKRLKQAGISSRWVTSREPILSSVIVKKNKLLEQGAEFVFLPNARIKPNARIFGYSEKFGYSIGRTLAVQEFEEYGFRDFGRPSRAIEQGMMPVKLARIMINLAEVAEDGIILDPFCGSGTILTEAMAMGYKNLIGTDVSEEAVQRTKENMNWVIQHLKSQIPNSVPSGHLPKGDKSQIPILSRILDADEVEHSRQSRNKVGTNSKFCPFGTSPKGRQIPNIKIQKCDVRELTNLPTYKLTNLFPVDAIVTEPYLGPIKFISSSVHQFVSSLQDLYLAAFQEFQKILKPDGRIVFIFPIFREDSKLIKTSTFVLTKIKNLGFKPIFSCEYSRPGQKVLREIFVLEKHCC